MIYYMPIIENGKYSIYIFMEDCTCKLFRTIFIIFPNEVR